MTGPLAGRRVATTRDRPGRLDEILARLGATVVHVPLIEVVDAPGDDLAEALDRLAEFDWVIVTSHQSMNPRPESSRSELLRETKPLPACVC